MHMPIFIAWFLRCLCYHVGASYATAWTNLLCHVLRRFVHDKKG
ncbi:hypothetical protein DAI22_03g036000 [Oryza sativa Japonica Group]|nr:hypothetical protein DAI22_03g036000 [Oryza sativa Japonica Group]